MDPVEIKHEYNSWKECTISAFEISRELIIAQEDSFINNNKIATKFICKEVEGV